MQNYHFVMKSVWKNIKKHYEPYEQNKNKDFLCIFFHALIRQLQN